MATLDGNLAAPARRRPRPCGRVLPRPLGFACELYGDPPNFAVANRDAATILLALADDPARIVPNWQIVDKTCNAYIRVDDADAVYAEVQERGAGIDYEIYDTPWGFREFGVQDPDGHDIAFGQPLSQ